MLIALVYAACAIIWGTTWFAIRRCIGPGGYPTFTAAALRFAIAAVILGAVCLHGRWRARGEIVSKLTISPLRAKFPALAASGVLGAIGYALVYAGERSISGGLASVLYGTFPLFTALLATLARIEKVTRRALVGSGIALVGTAIVFADRLDVSRAQGVGVLLVLVSVFVSALYSTIMKRAAADLSPIVTTTVFLGTGALVLGVFAVAVDREPIPWPPPPLPTVALLYLAIIGSVVVFAAYFFLLKTVSLMAVSTLVLIEPIIALGVDAVGEHDVVLVPRTWAGIAVTGLGIAVSVLRRRAPA